MNADGLRSQTVGGFVTLAATAYMVMKESRSADNTDAADSPRSPRENLRPSGETAEKRGASFSALVARGLRTEWFKRKRVM